MMPVEFRQWITREQVRAEPETLFVFGDNLQRRGFGGQARAMRGEPNAVGLVTKRQPDMTFDAFLTNDDLSEVIETNGGALARLNRHLRSAGKVVWPADGIGTGLAGLKEHAPKINRYYEAVLDSLRLT